MIQKQNYHKMITFVAPGERGSKESISEDSQRLASVDPVAEVVPSAFMILNEPRQIVSINRPCDPALPDSSNPVNHPLFSLPPKKHPLTTAQRMVIDRY